jgi:hypothetical protein
LNDATILGSHDEPTFKHGIGRIGCKAGKVESGQFGSLPPTFLVQMIDACVQDNTYIHPNTSVLSEQPEAHEVGLCLNTQCIVSIGWRTPLQELVRREKPHIPIMKNDLGSLESPRT